MDNDQGASTSRTVFEIEEQLGDHGDRAAILNSWRLRSNEEVQDQRRHKSAINLGCIILSRRAFLWLIGMIILPLLIIGVTKVTQIHHHSRPPPPPATDTSNITDALHAALMFFNAQKSGKLPGDNNVSWRGDSCMDDGRSAHLPYTEDLVGGYYDGGDAIKYNFPSSFAMTMLSWSAIEYGSKYKAAGELSHVLDIIRWGTDYFLKCFDTSSDTISEVVSQVGTSETIWPRDQNNGSCWTRPEDISHIDRPVTRCFGCSDLAAEMAAALASASILFGNNGDQGYSRRLVHGAKALFRFSLDQRGGVYSVRGTDATFVYNSTSAWDEMVWGAAWMFYATGDLDYLRIATDATLAEKAGAFQRGPTFGVHGWDTKIIGAQVLLTRLRIFFQPPYPYEEILREYHDQVNTVMCAYLPHFRTFNRTRGGLIQLKNGEPHSLQYVANAAFLAALFGDYIDVSGLRGWSCGPQLYHSDALYAFAETQVRYILGKNPLNMSYVVGFGHHYPTHVHHRGASIPTKVKCNCTTRGCDRWRDTAKPNPNIIVGAMMGGPDINDSFIDVRTDYMYTQPSIAGNAGLVSALVALSGERTVRIDENKMFSGIPPFYESSPPPPAPWQP